MTDERICELMGRENGMEIAFGDLAYRVRSLVETAERDEREACAQAALYEKVDASTGTEGDIAYNVAIDHAVAAIRARK